MDKRLTTQANHRSVRRFTNQPLTEAIRSELVTIAQHTATSHFLQSFSIIRIDNQTLRQQIADISHQSYVNGNGDLYIFVLDQFRAATLANAADVHELGSADKFMQGVSDTILAAQNMVNTAENLGLGTVILGSILNDPHSLIQLLKLPKYTFPVLGVIVGYPDQATAPKPRMPQSMMHFTDAYSTKSAVAEIDDYDRIIHDYYTNRQTNARSETFTNLLTKSATTSPAKRREILAAIHQQGFLIE